MTSGHPVPLTILDASPIAHGGGHILLATAVSFVDSGFLPAPLLPNHFRGLISREATLAPTQARPLLSPSCGAPLLCRELYRVHSSSSPAPRQASFLLGIPLLCGGNCHHPSQSLESGSERLRFLCKNLQGSHFHQRLCCVFSSFLVQPFSLLSSHLGGWVQPPHSAKLKKTPWRSPFTSGGSYA